MVIIHAPRHEAPSVLPKRTQFAAKDIARFVNSVLSHYEDRFKSDEELFALCAEKFKACSFSEVLSPMNPVIDQEFEDIHAIYTSIIVASMLREEDFLDIFIILLHLVVEVTKCAVPLTVSDMNSLRDILSRNKERTLLMRCFKKIFNNVIPVIRKTRLHVDHAGFSYLRDNLRENAANFLAAGAETGRSATVVPVGEDDVGLESTLTGRIIFKLSSQTSHNMNFRKDCSSVISDLSNIIRPPIARTVEDVSFMPSKDVKRLIKTGRKK